MIFLSTLLLAVLITIVLVPLFSTLAMRYQLVDIPNERKVHQQPIPPRGGIAMALGAFIPIIYWNYADRFVQAYLAGDACSCCSAPLTISASSPRDKVCRPDRCGPYRHPLRRGQDTEPGDAAPDNFLLPGGSPYP